MKVLIFTVLSLLLVAQQICGQAAPGAVLGTPAALSTVLSCGSTTFTATIPPVTADPGEVMSLVVCGQTLATTFVPTNLLASTVTFNAQIPPCLCGYYNFMVTDSTGNSVQVPYNVQNGCCGRECCGRGGGCGGTGNNGQCGGCNTGCRNNRGRRGGCSRKDALEKNPNIDNAEKDLPVEA